MKLTIPKSDLIGLIDATLNAIDGRCPLPALTSFLVQAENGRLELTATNMHMTVSASTAADVKEPGVTMIPAKKFSSVIRDLGPADVSLATDASNHTDVRSGRHASKILGGDPGEFPKRDQIEGGLTARISQSTLRNVLRQVQHAISTNPNRPELCGVYLKLSGDLIEVAACDGYRVACGSEQLDFKVKQDRECIAPAGIVNEMVRLLGDRDDAELTISDSKIGLALSGPNGETPVRLIGSLVAAKYPPYKSIIPAQDPAGRAVIDRDEFKSVLSRVSLMTSDLAADVRLQFDRNRLTISAKSAQVGEASEEMDVKYEGSPRLIRFNPRFILDSLKAIADDTIYFDLAPEGVLVGATIRTDGPFIHMVMPVREKK